MTRASDRTHLPDGDLHWRVGRIEDKLNHFHEKNSAREVALAVMQVDIHHIKVGQEKLYAGLNRVLWAIAIVAIGVITTFALSGGFIAPH